MADGFTLEWNGEELKKRVHAVSMKNVELSAKRVTAGAKKRVPIDNGTLKESIDERLWENKGVVGAYVEAGAPGEEHIAEFVELGTPGEVYGGTRKTSRRYKKKTNKYTGQKRTPIKAKPYLRPALRAEKKRFANSFKDAL